MFGSFFRDLESHFAFTSFWLLNLYLGPESSAGFSAGKHVALSSSA